MKLSAKMQAAADDLKALILSRHPDATFTFRRAVDDPKIVFLVAEADIDDAGVIDDLVIDEVVRFLVKDGIHVYVMPIPRRQPSELAQTAAASTSVSAT